jgi:hypothetical protein
LWGCRGGRGLASTCRGEEVWRGGGEEEGQVSHSLPLVLEIRFLQDILRGLRPALRPAPQPQRRAPCECIPCRGNQRAAAARQEILPSSSSTITWMSAESTWIEANCGRSVSVPPQCGRRDSDLLSAACVQQQRRRKHTHDQAYRHADEGSLFSRRRARTQLPRIFATRFRSGIFTGRAPCGLKKRDIRTGRPGARDGREERPG